MAYFPESVMMVINVKSTEDILSEKQTNLEPDEEEKINMMKPPPPLRRERATRQRNI
jgi:hypothetical protein